MKQRINSRLAAGAFAIIFFVSQVVHAEIDQEALSNTIDVLSVIARVATKSSKEAQANVSPTAEQRAAIIGEIARGAAKNNDLIQQNIVDAQSSIQTALENASCAEGNRVSMVAPNQFIAHSILHHPDFMDSAKIINTVVANVCADVVRVDQWQRPSPELLTFTATFRPQSFEQLNTWTFKIKRQTNGIWHLESKESIHSND